jgi:threonine/homoserine/homoserine lactone efflux protein
MHEYINLLLISTIGLISPGPDFIIVLKNTTSYSRSYGIWTAFGVALGTLVHITYIAFGFGVLLQKHFFILTLLKYIGAFYLIYIGYQSFKSKTVKSEITIDNPKFPDHL